jgi:hypothetical protein
MPLCAEHRREFIADPLWFSRFYSGGANAALEAPESGLQSE